MSPRSKLRIVTLLLLAALIGGMSVSNAQDTQRIAATGFDPRVEPPRITRVQYPLGALRRGMSGLAILCCDARADRSMDCRIAFDWPSGQHFGDASRGFVQDLRLLPESYAELQARPSHRFAMPVLWSVDPRPSQLDELAVRARRDTTDVCGPNTGPTPEFFEVRAHMEGFSRRGSTVGFDRDIPGSLPH